MKRAFIAALFLVCLPAYGAGPMPASLVGVWATDKAVLRGPFLFEGLAVYLGSDGIGAIVGGPPPIGVRIVATYKPDINAIEYQMTEHGKTVRNGTMFYDPVTQTIKLGEESKNALHRRYNELTESTRKTLGLEPTTK